MFPGFLTINSFLVQTWVGEEQEAKQELSCSHLIP